MSKIKRRILDSHVHLWPAETANGEGHTWMPPGMPIAKAQLPSDYANVTASSLADGSEGELKGLIFIETDVRYDTPDGDLESWAKGPLDEIVFVRNIVEGRYGRVASDSIVGVIPWAPMDQPGSVLERYLDLMEARAGETTWKRVKGFRFLLQSILDRERFKNLVLGKQFINNLRLLGSRGFSFDVGVDQRGGGSWQLEVMAEAMELAQEGVTDEDKVTFIINHLCKPEFGTGAEFERWCNAISSMSKLFRTYMKLSGAFSELPMRLESLTPAEIAAHLRPWIAHVFKDFGAKRVMFGSDWPVCNLKGPRGEDSWIVWKDVVESILADPAYRLGNDLEDYVWYKATKEAYRLA